MPQKDWEAVESAVQFQCNHLQQEMHIVTMTGTHEWSHVHCTMQLAVPPNSHLLFIWINFNWQTPDIQHFMLFLINAALRQHTAWSMTSFAVAEHDLKA